MVPFLGHGIGLRTKHFPDLLEQGRRADWFEVITENFLNIGGRPRAVLEAVRADRPVVLHGVSLSVGSVDPLDFEYLRDLRALADAVEPAWVSDHLCWGTFGRHNAHDLLPMPFNEESLAHVVSRVSEVQERLGRRMVLENVSSYLRRLDDLGWDFLAEVARRADCLICSAERVVSAVFLASTRAVPARHPGAGWRRSSRRAPGPGHASLDNHDAPVPTRCGLCRDAVRRFGQVSTLVSGTIIRADEVLARPRRRGR
jgi:hypothetical protein